MKSAVAEILELDTEVRVPGSSWKLLLTANILASWRRSLTSLNNDILDDCNFSKLTILPRVPEAISSYPSFSRALLVGLSLWRFLISSVSHVYRSSNDVVLASIHSIGNVLCDIFLFSCAIISLDSKKLSRLFYTISFLILDLIKNHSTCSEREGKTFFSSDIFLLYFHSLTIRETTSSTPLVAFASVLASLWCCELCWQHSRKKNNLIL